MSDQKPADILNDYERGFAVAEKYAKEREATLRAELRIEKDASRIALDALGKMLRDLTVKNEKLRDELAALRK